MIDRGKNTGFISNFVEKGENREKGGPDVECLCFDGRTYLHQL
jgi:hypothetical protein